ncbi:PD-(D/E)XK nuclease family protein [Leptolyngbya ohadii]|uniref:PD-(D/E)XK nuclease family protein n=1 Tax=Leptolyngbya ohadii TaxID=1962290 RepID=UPI000B59BC99|nr:PD-(D/E)XK nuclease family protein [Leptolyngbya ohadii]
MEPQTSLEAQREAQIEIGSDKTYLRLSQAQLQTLSTCPRKFQHLYLDQLGFPPTPDEQERLTWGDRFHLLMQQYQMGLNQIGLTVNPLLDSNEQIMQRSIEALRQSAPDLFPDQVPDRFDDRPDTLRFSEHRRTLQVADYLLTVIYDLLILEDDRAQILDWKTYPRPQNTRRLEQHWQTRLYLYVLAETSHYAPDRLSMTYWYVQAGNSEMPQPQSCQFSYSIAQHQRTQKDLRQSLDRLTKWLAAYDHGELLPQTTAKTPCQSCSFALRCQRESDRAAQEFPALADIKEVSL